MEQKFPFQTSPLPYSYIALMPYCDADTLYYHHDQYYVDAVAELNRLVVRYRLTGLTLRQLLTEDLDLPTTQLDHLLDTAGTVFNHQFYFACSVASPAGPPVNALTRAITAAYGSMDEFRQLLIEAAQGATGSNWLWLVSEGEQGLHLVVTPNNFTVDLRSVVPILGTDLWEHSYFMMNQFDKAAYIRNWYSLINWDAANRRYLDSLPPQTQAT